MKFALCFLAFVIASQGYASGGYNCDVSRGNWKESFRFGSGGPLDVTIDIPESSFQINGRYAFGESPIRLLKDQRVVATIWGESLIQIYFNEASTEVFCRFTDE